METQEERIKKLKERHAFELLNIDSGTDLIETERERQLNEEGHSRESDLLYRKDELVQAAMSYLQSVTRNNSSNTIRRESWPFGRHSFKPTDRLSNLVKAGALIAAEIDRHQYMRYKGEDEEVHEYFKDDGVDPAPGPVTGPFSYDAVYLQTTSIPRSAATPIPSVYIAESGRTRDAQPDTAARSGPQTLNVNGYTYRYATVSETVAGQYYQHDNTDLHDNDL